MQHWHTQERRERAHCHETRNEFPTQLFPSRFAPRGAREFCTHALKLSSYSLCVCVCVLYQLRASNALRTCNRVTTQQQKTTKKKHPSSQLKKFYLPKFELINFIQINFFISKNKKIISCSSWFVWWWWFFVVCVCVKRRVLLLLLGVGGCGWRGEYSERARWGEKAMRRHGCSARRSGSMFEQHEPFVLLRLPSPSSFFLCTHIYTHRRVRLSPRNIAGVAFTRCWGILFFIYYYARTCVCLNACVCPVLRERESRCATTNAHIYTHNFI